MHSIIHPLKIISRRRSVCWNSKHESPTKLATHCYFLEYIHDIHVSNPLKQLQNSESRSETSDCVHPVLNSSTLTEAQQDPDDELAFKFQNILKTYRDSSTRKMELALNQCSPDVSEDLILNVLRRHCSDWKSAYVFFNWVFKGGQIHLCSSIYNEILDILGKMGRFEEVSQVLEKMSEREGMVNEETYRVLTNRYAAAHKVEEAIGILYKRRELGLELDLVAFQKLLMYLCRYKQVEVAENLLHSKINEFGVDIKTMNIVLNGWCVLGNTQEAKRFWKDILVSKCKPDLFTYGTFIHALTKKGKLGTALKLYQGMWEKGCKPDVVICNCVIDALCFKKRIPEALEVFREMNERGCLPNVATYNSVIKHLCKIRRMEKVYELLGEMEQKETCRPNDITFNYLLRSLKKPEEVLRVLERMERNGCKMNADSYNLLLKLYATWDYDEKFRCTWDEMERNGVGLDRRSYTIMVHWLYDKGRFKDSLHYFGEMTSKGMLPEPRTKILVNAMNAKLEKKEFDPEETGASCSNDSVKHLRKSKRKVKS